MGEYLVRVADLELRAAEDKFMLIGGHVDYTKETYITIGNAGHEPDFWIDSDKAQQIIKHLTEVFELSNEQGE